MLTDGEQVQLVICTEETQPDRYLLLSDTRLEKTEPSPWSKQLND